MKKLIVAVLLFLTFSCAHTVELLSPEEARVNLMQRYTDYCKKKSQYIRTQFDKQGTLDKEALDILEDTEAECIVEMTTLVEEIPDSDVQAELEAWDEVEKEIWEADKALLDAQLGV